MFPAPFEFHKPASLDEAIKLLNEHGADGKLLAGGHSLVPMMKLRLAEPAHLIDINGIDELKTLAESDGVLRIGAGVTQAQILRAEVIATCCPILAEAAALIADPQVRYCGTIGGNVVNGDPGNDDPAVMIALAATYVLRGPGGEREVAGRDFYHGTYDTALEDNEILVEIRVPALTAGQGMAYQKMKRKVGDYATAAAAAVLRIEDGRCTEAALGLTNLGDCPIEASAAAAALVGNAVDDASVEAAAAAASAAADPVEDLRGGVAFRKSMAGEMTRRAIRSAARRAVEG